MLDCILLEKISNDRFGFKHYYKEYVCKHLTHLFPRRVSYNRFVELEKEVLLQLTVFIKEVLPGTCTGISFVDSTPLRVCRNQRILIHKTFEGLAGRGKSSMGWFFGFKLNLIINDKGEILNFMFTPGNVDDREPLKQENFLKNIKGKLCADKGYIGQALFENLFTSGIQLITKVKNNMKNSLMSVADKIQYSPKNHSLFGEYPFFRVNIIPPPRLLPLTYTPDAERAPRKSAYPL